MCGRSRHDRLFARFAATGDVHALGEVFDATAPELVRVAAHLLGDREQAGDLVQSAAICSLPNRWTTSPPRSCRSALTGASRWGLGHQRACACSRNVARQRRLSLTSAFTSCWPRSMSRSVTSCCQRPAGCGPAAPAASWSRTPCTCCATASSWTLGRTRPSSAGSSSPSVPTRCAPVRGAIALAGAVDAHVRASGVAEAVVTLASATRRRVLLATDGGSAAGTAMLRATDTSGQSLLIEVNVVSVGKPTDPADSRRRGDVAGRDRWVVRSHRDRQRGRRPARGAPRARTVGDCSAARSGGTPCAPRSTRAGDPLRYAHVALSRSP